MSILTFCFLISKKNKEFELLLANYITLFIGVIGLLAMTILSYQFFGISAGLYQSIAVIFLLANWLKIDFEIDKSNFLKEPKTKEMVQPVPLKNSNEANTFAMPEINFAQHSKTVIQD